MNLKNKLVKQKIFESWSPKIKKHLEKKGIKGISEAKMVALCEAAQVRKLYENATVANTPGRGSFSFGNNPSNASDTSRGSGEHFDSLFGVFIDSFASCIGLDLVPNLQMSKSNLMVNIVEPVYAGGTLNSATDRPEMFQVKLAVTGTPTALAVGTTYTVKDGNAGDAKCTLTYVGKDRARGYAIFRLGTVDAGASTETLSTLLDTVADNRAIYTDATNFVGFVPSTISYVNAYTNFVQGFAGAGLNDNEAWSTGRNGGVSSPMSRQTGETQKFRTMGLTKWSENFSAETWQVKVGYTTEFLQDLAMEEGMDAVQLAYDTISNELDQNINDEILTTIYGTGWGHHHMINSLLGVNLNLHIDASNGSAQTYKDETNTNRTIAGASGALISTTNGDNLPSMQRRIISRIGYASGVVGQRGRRGKANACSTNATISASVSDIRGFQPAPFENDLTENDNLYMVGSFKKMAMYEDPMQDLSDNRVAIIRKGVETDPGIKMLNYILAEKLETVAEGTMQKVTVLKSRLKLASVGTNPSFNYLTLAITQGSGQSII